VSSLSLHNVREMTSSLSEPLRGDLVLFLGKHMLKTH